MTPATPAPTPTPVVRSLTICLGEEPNTLYPYGSLNASARSVLSAVYDGPMDVVEYGYEPIILEKIPALEDGDAQVTELVDPVPRLTVTEAVPVSGPGPQPGQAAAQADRRRYRAGLPTRA